MKICKSQSSYVDPGIAFLVEWKDLRNDQEGEIDVVSKATRMSIQIEGDFAGATVIIEGSNDGAHFHTLTDPTFTHLTFRSASLASVIETVRFIRPRVSGGEESTLINVTLLIGVS